MDTESGVAADRDKITRWLTAGGKEDDLKVINFARQGKSYGQKHTKSFKHIGKGRTCFDCGSRGHLVRDCPQSINFTKAAASRIRDFNGSKRRKSVYIVLAHLCSELNVYDNSDVSSNSDDDDLAIFESMLVTKTSKYKTADLEMDNVEIMAVCADGFALKNGENEFWGACLDFGAKHTVNGKPQADAYCKLVGIKKGIQRKGEGTIFWFSSVNQNGIGKMTIRLPLGDDHFVSIVALVVPLDVPPLLSPDVMQQLMVVVSPAGNVIYSSKNYKETPLVSKRRHLYLQWPPSVFYTEVEFWKMHRNFYHLSSDKLYALLKRADGNDVNTDAKRTLEKVQRTCDTYHVTAATRIVFELPS